MAGPPGTAQAAMDTGPSKHGHAASSCRQPTTHSRDSTLRLSPSAKHSPSVWPAPQGRHPAPNDADGTRRRPLQRSPRIAGRPTWDRQAPQPARRQECEHGPRTAAPLGVCKPLRSIRPRPLRNPAARVGLQEPAPPIESRTTAGYQALGAQAQLPPNQRAQRGAPHAAEDALRCDGEAAHQARHMFGRQLICL